MVTMVSVSGSSDTSKRLWYQLAMARRSRGMPREREYRWVSGRRASRLQIVDDVEDIRRQALDSGKIVVQGNPD